MYPAGHHGTGPVQVPGQPAAPQEQVWQRLLPAGQGPEEMAAADARGVQGICGPDLPRCVMVLPSRLLSGPVSCCTVRPYGCWAPGLPFRALQNQSLCLYRQQFGGRAPKHGSVLPAGPKPQLGQGEGASYSTPPSPRGAMPMSSAHTTEMSVWMSQSLTYEPQGAGEVSFSHGEGGLARSQPYT